MSDDGLERRTFLKGLGTAALLGSVDTATAATGFSRVESPTQKSIKSVAVTEEGPYAVAGSGDIVARRVGGWAQSYEKVLDAGLTTQSKNLRGAAATANGRNFWACGSSGVVGQYDVVDEQFTDYSQPNDSTATWYDLSVVGQAGEETVYVANGSGEVLSGTKTAEGGMDWGTAEVVNGGNTIHALVVNADGTGWFCDSAANVYVTTDGASTWERIGVDEAGVSLYDVDGTGVDALTAVGGSGYLYEYDGSTWTERKPGQNAIKGVHRTSDDRIAVGSSGVVYTWDGEWHENDLSSSKTFHDVALDGTGPFPDTIVGNSGRIFERDEFTAYPDTLAVESTADTTTEYAANVSARTRKAPSADSDDSVTTKNGHYHVDGAVSGTGERDAYEFGGTVTSFEVQSGTAANLRTYVSGTEVSVERLTDRSWTSVASPVSKTLYDVVESSTGLYAVGGSGRVIARNGGSWEVVDDDGPSGGGNTLYGAGVTNDGDTVWFGGGSGALGKLDATTGTIENYTAPDGHTSTFLDVEVAGPAGSELVYLVNGSGQFIAGHNDGGTMTWEEPVKPGNGSTIYGVTFLDESVGYVCDGNAAVFETTDGGDSWRGIGVENAGVTLYDITARSRDAITVSGGSGKLFRYNGAVWTATKLGGNSRYAVDREADRGVAVGGGAQVYEREIAGWTQTLDDSSDVSLRSTLVTRSHDLPKVAVGGSGVILEQSFDDPLY